MKIEKFALALLALALMSGDWVAFVEAADATSEQRHGGKMHSGARNLGGRTWKKSNTWKKSEKGGSSKKSQSTTSKSTTSKLTTSKTGTSKTSKSKKGKGKGKGKGKANLCGGELNFLSDPGRYILRSSYFIDCDIDLEEFLMVLECVFLEAYNEVACDDTDSSNYRRIVSVSATSIIDIDESGCLPTTTMASGWARRLARGKREVVIDQEGDLDSTDCGTASEPAESDELVDEGTRRRRLSAMSTSSADPCGSLPKPDDLSEAISDGLAEEGYKVDEGDIQVGDSESSVDCTPCLGGGSCPPLPGDGCGGQLFNACCTR